MNRVLDDTKGEFVTTISILHGEIMGIGYDKFTAPDEDYFILGANRDANTEHGAWNILYGTRKCKVAQED